MFRYGLVCHLNTKLILSLISFIMFYFNFRQDSFEQTLPSLYESSSDFQHSESGKHQNGSSIGKSGSSIDKSDSEYSQLQESDTDSSSYDCVPISTTSH